MALKPYADDDNVEESNGTWVKVPNGDGTDGTAYANNNYAMLITTVDATKLELCTTTGETETLPPVVSITINASGLTIQSAIYGILPRQSLALISFSTLVLMQGRYGISVPPGFLGNRRSRMQIRIWLRLFALCYASAIGGAFASFCFKSASACSLDSTIPPVSRYSKKSVSVETTLCSLMTNVSKDCAKPKLLPILIAARNMKYHFLHLLLNMLMIGVIL